ncbi:small subunit ribosomal protein S11e [Nematocida homosporus]|uniref:small subunit ribosomal protein S11e n=1 Tax=Nematocida homosporus TaxID=1912981 RepID=UPI0022201DA3|nr:small subunit ribosomal protein S11e [Nematocida homosporus]KAI5184921.1 small subunit ribosomal protein S11e [Nematocida homosporus]
MQNIAEDLSKHKKYPQQTSIFNNPYNIARGVATFKRHVKSIGLGYKTPATAINGTYIDKKCPFTSDVTIRGTIFKGEIVSLKQERTAVVVKRYLHYHKKYMRYERRNTRFNVHLSPCWDGLVEVGDKVVCGETRPLSKTKHFAVIDFEKAASKGRYKQHIPSKQ